MKEDHFEFGDTDSGVVGLCAMVRAESKERALELLQAALPEEIEVEERDPEGEGVMYIRVYVNGENAEVEDIDTDNDDEDDEE